MQLKEPGPLRKKEVAHKSKKNNNHTKRHFPLEMMGINLLSHRRRRRGRRGRNCIQDGKHIV